MLKVKGLVALERRVRQQLRTGIPRTEMGRFRRTVSGAVAHIEAALARHGLPPGAMPAPTRNAYSFLKGIDLEDLPVNDGPVPPPGRLVGVSNVTSAAEWASAALSQLGAQPDPARQAQVVERIARTVNAVERICAKHDAAPSSLAAPTRRAYAWLKFLTVPANLERHLDATRRAATLAQRLSASPEESEPRTVVEFAQTAALWRRTQCGGVTRVRMTEGLIAADNGVLEAVLRAALTGDTSRHRKRYLEFTESEAYRDVLLELDLAAEVDADQPGGAVYDLRELFDAVNAEYFGGAVSRPRLTWSDRLTSRRLGYFEPQRDRIVVSRTLDSAKAPRFVVEYILHHELLHRRLGATWSGSRMRSHTAEFRREERKFGHYREAEEWMRGCRDGY